MMDLSEAKRARQACFNCRRKKSRCSGNRPTCTLCLRLKQECSWDDRIVTASADAKLLARLALLESKLGLLDDPGLPIPSTDYGVILPGLNGPNRFIADEPSLTTDLNAPCHPVESFEPLLPKDISQTLVNVYFARCHNQPYCYFHEQTFRHLFDRDEVPQYLLLALYATSLKFSQHTYFHGRRDAAIRHYANTSWAHIPERSFSPVHSLELSMAQATAMLAAIDLSEGRIGLSWIKCGHAARIIQGLRLNVEVDGLLPFSLQEEQIRTFWSVYILDRLVSLRSSAPQPSFLDSECTVRLPCQEGSFRNGMCNSEMPTLKSARNDPMALSRLDIGRFALVVIMAFALGELIQLVFLDTPSPAYAPWDSRSQFQKIYSILVHFESLSRCTSSLRREELRHAPPYEDDNARQQQLGHLLFSYAMYHLIQCLLNHPLTVHHLLQQCIAPAPQGWVQESLQRSSSHTDQLLALLQDAKLAGCVIETNFYGYCALIAGEVQRFYEYPHDANIVQSARAGVRTALLLLESRSYYWADAVPMATQAKRLRDFKPEPSLANALINPASLAINTPTFSAKSMLYLLDFALPMESMPSAQGSERAIASMSAPGVEMRINEELSGVDFPNRDYLQLGLMEGSYDDVELHMNGRHEYDYIQ